MTRPMRSSLHNEMLGVLSHYITRPHRETGSTEPTLELLRSLTTAVLFMADKLGKPATETLADLAAGVTEDLARQREAESAAKQDNGSNLVAGIDFPDPALQAPRPTGLFGGERTIAGGGTAKLQSGQIYRMRSGAMVTGAYRGSLNKATFCESATGRRWLPSGRFLGEHIEDDRDLVQLIMVTWAEGAA